MTEPSANTLYSRLGGYDAIAAVADNLLPRLIDDEQLGRFWQHRGDDGSDARNNFLLISSAIVPVALSIILAATCRRRIVACGFLIPIGSVLSAT